MLRKILILLAVINLSACSLLSTIPDTNELQKSINRAEINIEIASEINKRLYESQAIDKKDYDSNIEKIFYYKDIIAIIKLSFEFEDYDHVNSELENIKIFLRSLQ